MKLLYGKYEIGKVLEDGSVTLDLRAVTAALKERRGLVYDPGVVPPDEPYVVLSSGDLVALQALASHKHEGPKTWRKRLKEWL